MQFLRTPLKLPLVLFLISAVIGVWASYDTAASWNKFNLIVAAIVLYFVIANLTAAWLRTSLVWLGLAVSATFGIYFATQHDFASDPAKLGWVTDLGLALHTRVPQFAFHVPHPNVAAGALELALPLAVALVLSKFRQHARIEFVSALILTLAVGFGLLMTTSRGAWLALGVVGVGAVLVYVGQKIFAHAENASRLALPLSLNALIIGVLVLINFTDLFKLVDSLGAITAMGRSVSRLELYGQAAHLIQDYNLVGSGLGVFPMIFSTYALLIDVPFLSHAHDLFMQVWIEQGLLGFVAFIWTSIAFYAWVWKRRRRLDWLGTGALAATTVMLLHGTIDVLLYSSRFLPLMFVPMALTVASLGRARSAAPLLELPNLRLAAALAASAVIALAAILFVAREPLTAELMANLGSVEETRAELPRYHYQDRLVEFVRREADLSQAESYFRQALAADAGNVTANQRLAQIALARGNYQDALEYLLAAQERDPQNEVTWELLGEAYLGAGNADEALLYWTRVNDAALRLRRLARVRFERNGDTVHAKLALALADRIRTAPSQ